MSNKQMKTLTVGEQTFEITDAYARNQLQYQENLQDEPLPLTITQDELVNSGNGVYQIAVAYNAAASVNPGDVLAISGWQAANTSFPVFLFYDAVGNLLSYHTGDGSETLLTVETEVPKGAATVLVNGWDGYDVAVVRKGGVVTHTVETLAKQKASVDYVDSRTIVRKTIPAYEYPLTFTAGKLMNYGGYVFENAAARYAETNVTPGDVITITGYQWTASYGYYLYYFYDAEGKIVAYEAGDGTNVSSVRVVTVPEGAVRLLVNGHVNAALSVVGEKPDIVYDFFYLYEEVEKLKQPSDYKLITLGDSITALGTSERGWIKYFMEKTGCELVANTAVNSAVLSDYSDTVYDGNPTSAAQSNNVLGNQVQKIINNAYEAPDIILIAIGTNGGISITKEQIRGAYYDSSNGLIPLEQVDRTTNAGAYRWCLEKLQEAYPNAQIFWCTPIMGVQTIRSADNAMSYAESLRVATEYTGQNLIDTIRCGINGVNEVSGGNGRYLIDGLHPNVNGAKKIGYYNASKVLPFLGNGFALS